MNGLSGFPPDTTEEPDMSRIPGASPITTDIEEIRHSDEADEALVGSDFAEAEDVDMPEKHDGEDVEGKTDEGPSGAQVEAGMRS